jgi:hypothetical protein
MDRNHQRRQSSTRWHDAHLLDSTGMSQKQTATSFLLVVALPMFAWRRQRRDVVALYALPRTSPRRARARISSGQLVLLVGRNCISGASYREVAMPFYPLISLG